MSSDTRKGMNQADDVPKGMNEKPAASPAETPRKFQCDACGAHDPSGTFAIYCKRKDCPCKCKHGTPWENCGDCYPKKIATMESLQHEIADLKRQLEISVAERGKVNDENADLRKRFEFMQNIAKSNLADAEAAERQLEETRNTLSAALFQAETAESHLAEALRRERNLQEQWAENKPAQEYKAQLAAARAEERDLICKAIQTISPISVQVIRALSEGEKNG
jgi:regulator of replication initiation timing